MRSPALVTALACLAGAATMSGCGNAAEGGIADAAEQQATAALRTAAPVPAVRVTTPSRGTAPGYLFMAPKRGQGAPTGPLIFDNDGQAVWFKALPAGVRAYDFRVQRYQGKPVLTWWQGRTQSGFGQGVGVIYDDHYRQIATVRAGNGLQADFHEFVLSPRGTAYVLSFVEGRRDARRWGGTRNDRVMDNVIQEIDVATGKVLFQWRGLDHVSPGEAYTRPPIDPRKHWDPLHLNSINELPDGNLLVSSRDTHTTLKINRRTGRIMWRMGGKRSDFRMGKGTRTAWQHDAQRRPNGDYTWLDNRSVRPSRDAGHARGLQVRVSERAKRVTLVRSWWHDPPEISTSQANMQTLPNGNKLIGWGGSQPNLTEYGPRGSVRFEARLAAPGSDSYRAYRFPWTGRPLDEPTIAVTHAPGRTVARARWNGATEVVRWRLLTGAQDGELTEAATARRAGMDTALAVPAGAQRAAVEALGDGDVVLGRSATVNTGS